MLTDLEVINIMTKMCEQSCSPEMFDRWISLKRYLFRVRKSLADRCEVCAHQLDPAWHFCPECGYITK